MMLAATLLGACQASVRPPYPRAEMLDPPSPQAYSLCYGHGCRLLTTIRLTPAQWHEVHAHFSPPAQTAGDERARIAAAIGTLERLGAANSGVIRDLGGNRAGLGSRGQMDCIDESTNSSTYLMLFEQLELLRHHRYTGRVARGLQHFTFPHNTALIEETGSGTRFAVDSWFHGNGHAAEIVPLSRWLTGWRPEQPRISER